MTFPDNFFSISPTDSPTSADQIAKILENPGFGKYFTDHMVLIPYTEGQGWHDARVVPFGPIELMPTAGVLHYGQEIFEGIKAYRHPDGSIATFRPYENARRFQDSAARLAMPQLPEELFVRSIEELIDLDHEFVPAVGSDCSLYFRPVLFASEPVIGIRPAREYLYILLASPVEPYFSSRSGVSVWVSKEYVRAAPGGTGAAKCGGNYAASLLAQQEAAEKGCGQVVWLDAVSRNYIEEMGGMNLFFVYKDKFITPELTGSILPGITRKSIIELAKKLGYSVTETKVSIDQIREDATSGKLTEVFACGTAAVVTAVGKFCAETGDFTIGDGNCGPVTTQIREQLTGIQRGKIEDSFGWVHNLRPVPVAQ